MQMRRPSGHKSCPHPSGAADPHGPGPCCPLTSLGSRLSLRGKASLELHRACLVLHAHSRGAAAQPGRAHFAPTGSFLEAGPGCTAASRLVVGWRSKTRARTTPSSPSATTSPAPTFGDDSSLLTPGRDWDRDAGDNHSQACGRLRLAPSSACQLCPAARTEIQGLFWVPADQSDLWCRPTQEQGPCLTAAFLMECPQPDWERGWSAGRQDLAPAVVPLPAALSCQDPARCLDSHSISQSPNASNAKCRRFTMDGVMAALPQEVVHICHH